MGGQLAWNCAEVGTMHAIPYCVDHLIPDLCDYRGNSVIAIYLHDCFTTEKVEHNLIAIA